MTPDELKVYMRDWHQKHKTRRQVALRVSYWRRRYGVSAVWYLAQWQHQTGRCAICRTTLETSAGFRRAAHVDHDHTTGRVRGLLCGDCNCGLGCFKDRPELLSKAGVYMREAS